MIAMPSLAMGGLAAAAVAMWGQVRAVIRYIGSFAVVTADLDETLKFPMHQLIRIEFKQLPSGQLRYLGRYVGLKGRRNTSILPFKIAHNTAVYRRGWRVLIVKLKADDITLVTLRGMFNFEKLIVESIEKMEQRVEDTQNKEKAKSSRFQLRRVMGAEKQTRKRGSSLEGDDSPTASEGKVSSNNGYLLDTSLDVSFRFPHSEYKDDVETDPFENLYFDQSILKYIEQAKQWMALGDWYIERGIPWRRGWLMHSRDGGTGKSSLAKATAQTLRIPIYHFYLATLSDQEFMDAWQGMATPCVALFEDFDAVFHGRESQTEHKSLTFDCILNAISGVGSSDGVFLMVTTNHIEHIDHAMGVECGRDGISTRPGRIDSVIEFGMLSAENRRRMAHKILRDWPEEVEAMVVKGEGVTPIQFQEMCIQIAFNRLSEEKHRTFDRMLEAA